MSDEWEDFEDNCFNVIHGTGVGDKYEYKTVRRKVLSEREAFVAECDWKMRLIYPDVATDVYGMLYDSGARFK